jgi:hypothetical protein
MYSNSFVSYEGKYLSKKKRHDDEWGYEEQKKKDKKKSKQRSQKREEKRSWEEQ